MILEFFCVCVCPRIWKPLLELPRLALFLLLGKTLCQQFDPISIEYLTKKNEVITFFK